MTPAEIRAEIERLPQTLDAPDVPADAAEASPLAVVSKQGRLILRLSASAEALEGRVRELSAATAARAAEAESLRDGKRRAEQRARDLALEAIRLVDALDWARSAAAERNETGLVAGLDGARREAARRLAAVGVTEIACDGPLDGRLHEGVDTVPAPPGVERYRIVSVVRPGWQCGPDVLRRASVVTAD